MFDARKPNSNYTTPITSTDTLLKHVLETHGHIHINNKNIAYDNKSLTYKSLKELAIIDEAFHDTFLAKYGLTFTSFYFMALNFNEKLNQNDITYIADDDYTEMSKDELASESKKLIRELVSNIAALHNLDSKLEVNIYDTFIADNHRYFRVFAEILSKYDNLVRAILANSDISLEVTDEEMPPVDEENTPIDDTPIENSPETETEDEEDIPIEDTPIENHPETETEDDENGLGTEAEDEENDSMDPTPIPQPGQEQEDTPTVLPEVDDSITSDKDTEDEDTPTVLPEVDDSVASDTVTEDEISKEIINDDMKKEEEEVQTDENSENSDDLLPENARQDAEESEEAIEPEIVEKEDYNMGVLPQEEIDALLGGIRSEDNAETSTSAEKTNTETIHLLDGTVKVVEIKKLTPEESEQILNDGFQQLSDAISSEESEEDNIANYDEDADLELKSITQKEYNELAEEIKDEVHKAFDIKKENKEDNNTQKILDALKEALIDSKMRNNIENEYLYLLKSYLHDGKLRKDLFENKNINHSADLGTEYIGVNIKQIHFKQTSNLSKIRELAQYNFYIAFELMNKTKLFYDFQEEEFISINGMRLFNIARLFLANVYIIKYVDDTKKAKLIK